LEDIVYYNSPIEQIEIKASKQGISFICFMDKVQASSIDINPHHKSSLFQLDLYFNGSLKNFSLELKI